MTPNTRASESLTEVLGTTKNILYRANKLVPCSAFVLAIFAAGIVAAATVSVPTMLTVVILLVTIVAVVVYWTTESYGESALALVAGLLTAFTVQWTPSRFIAFSSTWILFSLIAVVITSIKLAARDEDIYRHAALALAKGSDPNSEVEDRLRQIGKSVDTKGFLGPLERAEAVRFLAFRNVSPDSMAEALKTVEMLSVVTQVGHDQISHFVADLYHLLGDSFEDAYHPTLDFVYETIRDSPAAPEEFMDAFKSTRRHALSGRVDVRELFRVISTGLEEGVHPEDMRRYVDERVGDEAT